MLPVAEPPPVIGAAFFILIQDPECNADIRGDKELPGKNDDCFHFVVLDQLLPNLQRITVSQGSVGQQESSHTVQRLQMGKDVQNPGIVRITCRRRCIICPSGIIFQIVIVPTLQIKGRIGHDVIEIEPPVQVVCEGRITCPTEIMAEPTQDKIHLCQPVCCGLFFLTIHIDTADVSLLCLDQFSTLDKHATRTAARVV